MMAALLKRSIEGGSYHVELSLARSAMWVQDLGFLDIADQVDIPSHDDYPARQTTVPSVYGSVSFLAPPLAFSNLRLPNTDRISQYGADEPARQPRHQS